MFLNTQATSFLYFKIPIVYPHLFQLIKLFSIPSSFLILPIIFLLLSLTGVGEHRVWKASWVRVVGTAAAYGLFGSTLLGPQLLPSPPVPPAQ